MMGQEEGRWRHYRMAEETQTKGWDVCGGVVLEVSRWTQADPPQLPAATFMVCGCWSPPTLDQCLPQT